MSKLDIATIFKICGESGGSQYYENHPLLESIVERTKNKDKIGIIATGNNEGYSIELSRKLERNGKEFKIYAIDPEFEENRNYENYNIKIVPETYQKFLDIDEESSKSKDAVENLIKEDVKIIGLELCSHQLKDKKYIEEMLERNNYVVEEIFENVIIGEKGLHEYNPKEEIDEYLKWRKERGLSYI